ncbi:hypothetical protein PLICRDRAFT_98558 [Plicaturopsis crispa FD-325 SS-3]|nr:hypothetical protein PLICRDRAFT_98558 [Plicaturopsis crispa FD-325 SS-3]
MFFFAVLLGTLAGSCAASCVAGCDPGSRVSSAPLVQLECGTFQGFSANSTDSFLGIPFAQPPVGTLRFRHPLPPKTQPGVQNATMFSNACPQQSNLSPGQSVPTIPGLNVSSILSSSLNVNVSEDCLYLNVIRPSNISDGHKIPVVVWIYGGGFATGTTASFDGAPIVERSVALGEPIIYVSMNYRLNAFGFLAGEEVQDAGIGNLGLHDQRFALQWVQKHISLFGGDPSKVIIWGESAGSVSVIDQILTNDGENDGLFRGAVMESGFSQPTSDITAGQPIYDHLVASTNCTTASSTLECLRAAPYDALMRAVDSTPSIFSYSSLDLTWPPRVDGIFLKRTPRESLEAGQYAQVPIIGSDCDDEATLFSLFSTNVTTNETFIEYVREKYLVGTNDTDLAQVAAAYPEDPSEGSPFDTGDDNTVTPEFKRIAAFQGDFLFQAPRRQMFSVMSQTKPVWSFLFKRGKDTPVLGAYHSSDLQEFYVTTSRPDYAGTDALINFAYNLDPNTPPNITSNSVLANVTWPQWTRGTGDASPQLLSFENETDLAIRSDDYRQEAMELLSSLTAKLGL